MNKNYNTIAVYDLLFYRVDEDGNAFTNEKGKPKIYRAEMDCQYLADGLDVDDLIEV